MGETTGIAWCDHTFNPWRGCTKVSAGCEHCYAETLSKRNPGVLGVWGPAGSRAVGVDSYWRQPVRWEAAWRKKKRAGRVFCLSLGDVFEAHRDLPPLRERLGALILATPHLDWLLLTKRPERWREAKHELWSHLPAFPHNVWLGVSVEDQATADERIPLLLQAPAAVRFVSYEPALGPVSMRPSWLAGYDYDGPGCSVTSKPRLDWVIVGGESGPGARRFDPEWGRAMIEACKAADVACFMKQVGSNPKGWGDFDGVRLNRGISDRKGGDPEEWDEDLRVREFPEAKAVTG